MINPSDFAPLIARTGTSPAPAARSANATAANPASWFDSTAISGDTRISADLNPAARGLSVAQHAEQVLGHLCGEREDRA